MTPCLARGFRRPKAIRWSEDERSSGQSMKTKVWGATYTVAWREGRNMKKNAWSRAGGWTHDVLKSALNTKMLTIHLSMCPRTSNLQSATANSTWEKFELEISSQEQAKCCKCSGMPLIKYSTAWIRNKETKIATKLRRTWPSRLTNLWTEAGTLSGLLKAACKHRLGKPQKCCRSVLLLRTEDCYGPASPSLSETPSHKASVLWTSLLQKQGGTVAR